MRGERSSHRDRDALPCPERKHENQRDKKIRGRRGRKKAKDTCAKPTPYPPQATLGKTKGEKEKRDKQNGHKRIGDSLRKHRRKSKVTSEVFKM